ncbi:MAG: hypothetical protein IJ828_06390 [Treponema sp.]|nr:hypothetical protein [Treponema sp.]
MKNYKMFLIPLGILFLTSASSLHSQILKNAEQTSLSARIPIGLSWWTPADDDWRQSLAGIAGVRAGIELFPVKVGLTPENGIIRLYGRALVNWRIGAGSKSTYSALFNEFGIQAGLFARLNITRQHGIYAGAGPLWAVELHSFKPKYGEKKTMTQRGTAIFCTVGYNFQLKDKLSLFLEFDYEHFITEGLVNVIVPAAGITLGL